MDGHPVGFDDLRVRFVFVPDGAPVPWEWMADWTDIVRVPAMLVLQYAAEEAEGGAGNSSSRFSVLARLAGGESHVMLAGEGPEEWSTVTPRRNKCPPTSQSAIKSSAKSARPKAVSKPSPLISEVAGGTVSFAAIGATAACTIAEPCGGIEFTAIAALAMGAIILSSESDVDPPERSNNHDHEDQQIPSEIVAPGGVPIGKPSGSGDSRIRNMPDGASAAQDMFERLTKGKGGIEVTPPGYHGKLIKLPDGSYIGYRPRPRSGSPAIDVKIPGLPGVRKIHY